MPSTNSVAEPECQAGQKADLGDVDGAEAVIRIDPEADRAAGEYGGADIVADRVAGEARQRRDAIGHVLLADGSQREEIIKCQRAERADHAQRCQRDMGRRNLRQRHQDHAGIDTLEGADQRGDGEGDDEEARGDSEPFPADPFLEATPQRGQQSMHSSSRRGGNQLRSLLAAIDDSRCAIARSAKTHKAKTPRCAVLDKAWPSTLPSGPLSHSIYMP